MKNFLFAALVIVVGFTTSTFAAIRTVDNTSDTGVVCDAATPGDCGFTGAISGASDGDEIRFDAAVFNAPVDYFGNLALTRNLTITGPGAAILRIRSRVVVDSGTVVISGVTIANDLFPAQRGGGVLNNSVLTLRDCVVTNNRANSGGGIYNNSGASLTLINSAVVNNVAPVDADFAVAGIMNVGTLAMTGTTVSGNVVENPANVDGELIGGILDVGPSTTVSNSTITNNDGSAPNFFSLNVGGLLRGGNGTTTIRSSIIAGNAGAKDVSYTNFAPIISGGYNLIGNADGLSANFNQIGDQKGTAANPLNARLDALGNYGGVIPSHRLQTAPVISPAVDKGRAFGSTTDTTGRSRTFDHPLVTSGIPANGDNTDIGAAELQPSNWSVTKIADTDDGVCSATDCSLREAIATAGYGDSIGFSTLFDSPRTISLTNGELLIEKYISIDGPAADKLVIAGTGLGRIFNVTAGTVTISGMRIQNGLTGDFGGGIQNIANLTVRGVQLQSNYGGNGGGAIYNSGTLTLVNSTLNNNQSNIGGGIRNVGGNATIVGSTISGNNGGVGSGVSNGPAGSSIVISGSTIAFNNGGGIANNGGGIQVRSSLVARNTTGDVSGVFTSGGFNLIGATDGATGFTESTDQTGTSASPLNPLISGLSFNGGPIQTHRLNGGSPAIETGNSFGAATDGRGFARSFDLLAIPSAAGGDGTDIGAFELSALTVLNGNDSGVGSLRQMIADVASGEAIQFATQFGAAPSTIALASTLTIDKSVTIIGPGANLLTLSGGNARRVVNVASTGGIAVTLAGLKISGGFSQSTAGGGIGITGAGAELTLNRVTVSGNSAFGGGGIALNSGLLTINNSLISANSAFGQNFGNQAGSGLLVKGGTATVNNSLFENNAPANNSTRGGGGAAVEAGGVLNINSTTFRANSEFGSGAGLYIEGMASVVSSIFDSNHSFGSGGGIGIRNGGVLSMRNSTVSRNVADSIAGGIENFRGAFNIINSTISSNTSGSASRGITGRGAGVLSTSGSDSAMFNVTIAGNTMLHSSFNPPYIPSAGIERYEFATGFDTGNVFLQNVVIGVNIGPTNVAGRLASLGNNIVDNAANSSGWVASDRLNQNPLLSPLGDYGGPTETHALLPGSPAIDNGNNCILTTGGCMGGLPGQTFDQRGLGAARKIGTTVDVGAFERNIDVVQTSMPPTYVRNPFNGGAPFQFTMSRQSSLFDENGFRESDIAPAAALFAIVPVAGEQLAPGLTLSTSGVLSGTPTTGGNYAFTVKATDSDGQSGVRRYVLQVLVPTSAGVSVGGRVTVGNGQGLRGAQVVLTDQNGNSQIVKTGTFGFFAFAGIPAGQTVTLVVISKKYNFAPRIFEVAADIADADFSAPE